MTREKFDRDFWERLWSKTLREHADKVAGRPPNAHLMAELAHLPPGRALDASAGHGADALWLAAHGWQVTAVDFSPAALAHGRSMAETAGAEIAERVDWVEGDLATWTVEPGRYDLRRSPDVQLVLNGHTHRPMVRHFAGVTIVNGGTIFRQHEPGYLILDFGSGAALWHSLVPGAPARSIGSLFG